MITEYDGSNLLFESWKQAYIRRTQQEPSVHETKKAWETIRQREERLRAAKGRKH